MFFLVAEASSVSFALSKRGEKDCQSAATHRLLAWGATRWRDGTGLVYECSSAYGPLAFKSLSSSKRSCAALFPRFRSLEFIERIKPSNLTIFEGRKRMQQTRALRAAFVAEVGNCTETRAEDDAANRTFGPRNKLPSNALHSVDNTLVLHECFFT